MDTTYHLIARLMVRHFDEELLGIYPYQYGSPEWDKDILYSIPSIIEDYALDKYDEKGFSLVSTPSIMKQIDENKLVAYLDAVEYDICVIKLFDYNGCEDFFDESGKFLNDRLNEMWDAYA